MRGAQAHISWTDSMASSATISGSRSLVMRQRGGRRLVRQAHRLSNQSYVESVHQLIRNINPSMISEEPETIVVPTVYRNAQDGRPRNTDALQNYSEASLSWYSIEDSLANSDGSEGLTRITMAKRAVRRVARQLFRLIRYYVGKFVDNYSATVAVHRPYQFVRYY